MNRENYRGVLINLWWNPGGVVNILHFLANAQNEIENISSFTSHSHDMDSIVKQLTKDEYIKIVQKKRRDFVHEHFTDILTDLFNRLETEANKMKKCHFEARFVIPEHFDTVKTEALLREYFRDIGFETIAEPRKDETTTIILTLT
jgi:plasmid replication initiation protein